MEALYKCLLKKPFHETSIKDIAVKAGVNHGVLHYYFKSKEDILLHFMDYILDKYVIIFADFILSAEKKGLKGKKMVLSMLNHINTQITFNHDLSKVFIEIWHIATYNKKVKKKLNRTYEEWEKTLSLILKRNGLDATTSGRMATAFIALHEGISLFSVILERKDHRIEGVLKELQSNIIQMLPI